MPHFAVDDVNSPPRTNACYWPQCRSRTAIFGSGGGALLAEEAGAALPEHVPLDLALREAADEGTPPHGQPFTAVPRTSLRMSLGDLSGGDNVTSAWA
jgi:hypothetical protein